MADGRIIIDTRIRKDNAKKDLNELRKDAQATASEISKIDQKIHEAQGDTKLADDLKNAQAAAAATEKEIVREESSGAPMSLEVEQPIQLLLDGEVIYRTVTRIKANRGAAVSSKFAEEY